MAHYTHISLALWARSRRDNKLPVGAKFALCICMCVLAKENDHRHLSVNWKSNSNKIPELRPGASNSNATPEAKEWCSGVAI